MLHSFGYFLIAEIYRISYEEKITFRVFKISYTTAASGMIPTNRADAIL